MYIPPLPRVLSGPAGHPSQQPPSAAAEPHRLQTAPGPSLHDLLAAALAQLFSSGPHAPPVPAAELRRRDPLQSTNVTIGAVVGVLVGVFVIGALYFCVRYHRSIRFSDKNNGTGTRRRRRSRRSGGTGSSRGSKASSSGSSAPAPAPPPPPPPAAG